MSQRLFITNYYHPSFSALYLCYKGGSLESFNQNTKTWIILGGEWNEGSDAEEGTNNWLKNFSVDKEGSVYFATSVYNNI